MKAQKGKILAQGHTVQGHITQRVGTIFDLPFRDFNLLN